MHMLDLVVRAEYRQCLANVYRTELKPVIENHLLGHIDYLDWQSVLGRFGERSMSEPTRMTYAVQLSPSHG